jgi:hypothetical protein
MAQFFDDKEEVIDIELTEWGKYLYSIGKFKPTYYAFSDDEVLYDSAYAGVSSEEQKEIVDRITDSTPYLKPHVRFKEAKTYYQEYDSASEPDATVFQNPLDSAARVDTLLESKIELIKQKAGRYSQSTKELERLILSKVGTVRTTTQDYPAFDVTFLQSRISSSSNSLATDFGYLKIPQINVNLQNIITVVPPNTEFISRVTDGNIASFQADFYTNVNESDVFPDGSKIVMETNFLAIDVFQNGAEYKNQNFNVQVFERVQESGSFVLKPLKLEPQTNGVDENGFLIPVSPLELSELEINASARESLNDGIVNAGSSDGDYISNYFSIQIDREIPNEVLCSLAKRITKLGGNIRLDYDVECSDSLLTFRNGSLVRNVVSEGVEVVQAACDEEQGGTGCHN